MRGFSLIELAIVVAIIGLITVGVLKGQSLINSAKTQEVMKQALGLAEAAKEFKARYGLMPGDMQNPPVPGLIAACQPGGDSNGLISAQESRCIPDLLEKANMNKVSGVDGDGFPIISSSWGTISLRSASNSQVSIARGSNLFNRGILYVVELDDLECETATSIDRSIDNDDLSIGKVIASVDTCVKGGVNDPVPLLAIGF